MEKEIIEVNCWICERKTYQEVKRKFTVNKDTDPMTVYKTICLRCKADNSTAVIGRGFGYEK